MIEIDSKRIEVIVNGKHIKLNPKEFGVLKLLKAADGHVLTREKIFSKVWGYDKHEIHVLKNHTRKIDTCISKLRRKISKVHRASADRIVTVPKAGYKLVRKV